MAFNQTEKRNVRAAIRRLANRPLEEAISRHDRPWQLEIALRLQAVTDQLVAQLRNEIETESI